MNTTYNLEYLNEISGGDVSFVHQMIKEFIEIAPQTLNHLKHSCQIANWPELKEKIHQFAPQLEYLGLHSTRQLADSIEQNIKGSPVPDRIEELLNQIIADCYSVIEQLKLDYPINANP